jgi:hypothetical protein
MKEFALQDELPLSCENYAILQMRALEEERLRALEAAARARTEVAELTESRRKLQWQSKLLEKMSEVWLPCVGPRQARLTTYPLRCGTRFHA